MTLVTEMTDNQRRMLVDTRQVWEAYRDAYRRRQSFEGGMTWKTAKGRDYLVRIYSDVLKKKKQTSLGVRSPETERIFTEFHAGKVAAGERLASLANRLAEQGRLNKAVNLGRVPTVPARILRMLDRAGLLGRNVFVAGTYALLAYESAAGIFIERGLLATGDLDLLMESRARLKLTTDGLEAGGLLGLLRKVDKSFERGSSTFRAVNRDGFYVDLIKPLPSPPWKDEREAIGDGGDLMATAISNMRWVANAPKFEAVAVGEDGLPVPMACPDPRAFALYKLWMGTQDASRDPVKRQRDRAQAEAVAHIVHRWMPHLPFSPEHLASFPQAVRDLGGEGQDPFFR